MKRQRRFEYCRNFLNERATIYQKYARELHAQYIDHLRSWKVINTDGSYRDLDFNDPRALGLLVNHAYWLGAHDMRDLCLY